MHLDKLTDAVVSAFAPQVDSTLSHRDPDQSQRNYLLVAAGIGAPFWKVAAQAALGYESNRQDYSEEQ